MDEYTDGQMDGRTYGRTDVRTDGRTYRRTDVWTYGRTDGWTKYPLHSTEHRPFGAAALLTIYITSKTSGPQTIYGQW